MYRLHKRKGEYNTQRGNREEGGDCLNQQRRVLCFSPSLLPLSIVLLSICFLPSSSYLSDSYTIGTWINLCQQTRAHRPDSLCGLVQSLCSILPLHTQPHISTVSHSVSAFQETKTDWKVSCVHLCVFGTVGRAGSIWPLSCCTSPSMLCCVQCQEKQHRL